MECFSINWLWVWIIFGVVLLGWLVNIAIPNMISNRTSCFNDCIHFKKGECYLYGSGHVAKHPCPDYFKYRNKKYLPEEDDE